MLVCVMRFIQTYIPDDKFITHFFLRQIYHHNHSFAFNKLTNCFNVLKPTLWKVVLFYYISTCVYEYNFLFGVNLGSMAYRIM